MKKTKNNLSYVVLGCGILLSALVLIFMTMAGVKGNILGSEVSVYGMMSYGNETRIGVVLAMVFVIAALAVAVLSLVLKLLNVKFALGGWLALCAAVLALVAGILYFCGVNLIGMGDSGLYSLATGSVLCGVFAILNAVALGFYAVTELKK